MSAIFACVMLFCQAVKSDAAPDDVQRYLNRCEAAHLAAVKAGLAEVQSSMAQRGAASDPPPGLQAAKERWIRLSKQSAPLLPLPLPPSRGDMGIFSPASPADARHGRSVDVLEVVGANDAIVRAWYVPEAATPAAGSRDAEATFIDLWVQGINTSRWVVGSAAKLEGVFHATGNQSFATACGQRSVPLVEPVDIERYRKSRPK